ncbi:MAG: glycine oxidase ThiO [Planctomycetia bacterium]|nr:glycine oxidase ThiO [Planctomycetia bacterium]
MDDCLIVGGGVIGLSLAYELAGQGCAVHVLERGLPGREASWAGAGILPPGSITAPVTPDEKLARLCHDLHPQWAARLREETGIDNGYWRCGGIYLARTVAAAQGIRQQARYWKERGITVIETSPAGLAECEPALAGVERGVTAALFLPDEAQLRNPRHMKALLAACASRGVRVSGGVTVDDFETARDRVVAVRATSGRFAAGTICVTGGAWSRGLLARLGVAIAVKPIRGQIALLNTGAPVLRRVINEGRCYLVPRADGRVLVGSTEEDVGFDKQTTAEAIAGLLSFATELVPALAAAQLETCWAGLRPGSADGRPYLGRVPGYDNMFVAAGHFRSGLQLSPGTAVLMRQAILGQATDVDLSTFGVDRG